MLAEPLPIERTTRRVVLLVILLQSIGIRALPLQGTVSGVGVCAIMILHSRLGVRTLVAFLLPCLAFLAFSARGMTHSNAFGYLALVLATGALFVHYTGSRWADVESDLLAITWWLSLHGLVSYALFQISPHSFGTTDLGGLQYRVLGPFVLSDFQGARATGLCWEPGLFQYVANVCLLLCLKSPRQRWRMLVPFAAVVASHSTTGIFALVPSFLYVLVGRRWSGRQLAGAIAAVAVAIVLSVTVFRPNIEQKLSGTDTSGLVRLRDLKVGWDLFYERPLVGHGQFDEDYLAAHSSIYRVSEELFSKEFLADNTELTGGYTNGIMSVFGGYGVLLGGLLFWSFWKNQLLQGARRERLAFFAIFLVTSISERITGTSWFYMLAISGVITLVRGRPAEESVACP